MKVFSSYGNKHFWTNRINKVEKITRKQWLKERREARTVHNRVVTLIEENNVPDKLEGLINLIYKN